MHCFACMISLEALSGIRSMARNNDDTISLTHNIKHAENCARSWPDPVLLAHSHCMAVRERSAHSRCSRESRGPTRCASEHAAAATQSLTTLPACGLSRQVMPDEDPEAWRSFMDSLDPVHMIGPLAAHWNVSVQRSAPLVVPHEPRVCLPSLPKHVRFPRPRLQLF